MIYTTLELLSDLKNEVHRLMPNIKVTNEFISELLVGQKGRQFESKMTQARRSAKKGKTYLIAENVIEGYETNLRKNFKDNMANFIEFFSRYRKVNSLNKFSKSTLNFNPNLVLDYLKIKLYNMEKTICDFVRLKFDIHVLKEALSDYIIHPKMDLDKLTRYAKILRVDKTIQKYLEVLI